MATDPFFSAYCSVLNSTQLNEFFQNINYVLQKKKNTVREAVTVGGIKTNTMRKINPYPLYNLPLTIELKPV